MANLMQGFDRQQASTDSESEVVCVDLSMTASALQGLAKDLRRRLKTAEHLGEAVVKAVNKPALSSADVLVGFYRGGKVKLSVSVPDGLESKEVIQLLGTASADLEGSVADAEVHVSGQPYKKEAKKEADVEASEETTEAPPADEEKEETQDGSPKRKTSTLVVVLCTVAGIGAAVLIAMLLPGGGSEGGGGGHLEPGGRPGLRPPADSTASAYDGSPGVAVHYAVSDADLSQAVRPF